MTNVCDDCTVNPVQFCLRLQITDLFGYFGSLETYIETEICIHLFMTKQQYARSHNTHLHIHFVIGFKYKKKPFITVWQIGDTDYDV